MIKGLIFIFRGTVVTLGLFLGQMTVFAQNPPVKPAPQPEPSFFESYGLYLGIIAVLGLVGFMVMRRKKEAETANAPAQPKGDDGIKLTFRKKEEKPAEAPKPKVETAAPAAILKAKKGGLESLPVSSFTKVQRANYFIELPESTDPALLKAIEVTSEESEADTAERTQALKLLLSFKNSNAVNAVAQVALYDLSSKLRSDAVSALADIDHESAFESIVTACADPTREVRAAGARALFKLTFDRSHAWARIIESGDMSRMRHAARCAIEGDLVERSFDRLTHTDRKIAYEAFTLTALLIRAGETDPIYRTIATHRDETVKLALLHVLETIKEDQTFEGLSDLLTRANLTPDVAAKVNEVRSCLQLTHA